MSESPNIKIQIVFSARHIPEDLKNEFFKTDGNIPLPKKSLVGAFYTVDGTVKRAFICAFNAPDVQSEKGEECFAQVLAPPDDLEPWEIPMAAERILSELQRELMLIEVPAWSVKTFGLKE